MSSSMSVGVIGLGIMGSAIAHNLVRAGFTVIGFDVAAAPLDALRGQGGKTAASVAELVGQADVILTSLPSPSALDATVVALCDAGASGKIVAELSTLTIEDKQRAFDALAAVGVVMLDCPLSGTGAQARTGDLAVFASGDHQAVERCRAVFAGFARVVHDVGAFGNGCRMKFVANLLVAIHNVATAEALVLGMKAGLDPHRIVEVIQSGAGNSRVFELRAPLMADRRYEPPSMKLDVWQKDMSIIGDFVKEMGVAAPLFDATVPVYDAALDQGLAAQDTAAVCTVLERKAGLLRGTGG
jgi:3-hydroxyisobutyrate dehydrogenase-like beta-hydroxyacid dehydrogenase